VEKPSKQVLKSTNEPRAHYARTWHTTDMLLQKYTWCSSPNLSSLQHYNIY